MSDNESIIEIHLDKSCNTKAFPKQELIQQDAVHEFFDHIKHSLKNVERYCAGLPHCQNVIFTRYHDTITIIGDRGAGKTTFILTMFEMIKNEYTIENANTDDKYRTISGDDVEILGIIDPTLIEDKENVFINVISRIKQKIDYKYLGKYDHCIVSPEQNYCPSDYCPYDLTKLPGKIQNKNCPATGEGEYRDWTNSLQKLAEGLHILDGIGNKKGLENDSWHDPLFIMEEGLKNARAGNELEINFHQYVARSLKLLDKKAFIIAFDDIDTRFKAGWPVLEIIRKYLTTPQLITVIAGNLSLYSLLVRQNQWSNFHNKFLTNEEDQKNKCKGIVDNLENQYMIKLLKPERRITLKPLAFYANAIKIKNAANIKGEDNKDIPLNEYINEILYEILYLNKSDIELYKKFLLCLPIRSTFQILYAYEKFLLNSSSDKKKLDGEKLDDKKYSKFINTIIDVFWVTLNRFNFDIDFVENPDVRTGLNKLVIQLAENKLLERGYNLKADFTDPDINKIMCVLATILTQHIQKNPYLIFDYFVIVGLAREVARVIPDDGEKRQISGKILFQNYLEWSGINAGFDAITIAGYYAGFIRQIDEPRQNNSFLGTVALISEGSIDKNNISQYIYGLYHIDDYTNDKQKFKDDEMPSKEFFESIKKNKKDGKNLNQLLVNDLSRLQKRVSSWHKIFISLPVVKSIDKKNKSIRYWSIHTLLAVIGELLKCRDESNKENIKGEKEGKNETETETKIKNILTRFSQIRDYPLSKLSNSESKDEKNSSDDHTNSDEKDNQDISKNIIEEEINPEFIKLLCKWINQENIDVKLPVHVFGNMFQRFYNSIRLIDENKKYKHLGWLIHRYIIVFLNSVLVEEYLYREKGEIKIELDNPTGSDSIFNANYKKIFVNDDDTEKQDASFSKWIISCPVWLIYLNTGLKQTDNENCKFTGTFKNILQSHKDFKNKDFKKKNLENLINKVLYDVNSKVKFLNLYPLLNTVVVHNMSKPKLPNPKPSNWTINEFDEIVKNNNAEVRKLYEKHKNDKDDYIKMTKSFVTEFIRGKYRKVPTRQADKPFKDLQGQVRKWCEQQ